MSTEATESTGLLDASLTYSTNNEETQPGILQFGENVEFEQHETQTERSGKRMREISVCYAILVLNLAIVFNLIWVIPSSEYSAAAMTNLERFYTFLYVINILILVAHIIPLFLPETLLETFGIQKGPINSSISWSATILGLGLGVFTIIYCLIEMRVFMILFNENDIFTIVKINPILVCIMVFLEMGFLYMERFVGQFYWSLPLGLGELHRLGKMHILMTNMSLWIKILSKETVVSALEYLQEKHMIYTIKIDNQTFTLPPCKDACAAYDCFTSGNCALSMWGLEQGFSCQRNNIKEINFKHFGSNFYPFIIEFCTLMICIFYETFRDTFTRQRRANIEAFTFSFKKPPIFGVFCGLIPVITVSAISMWVKHEELDMEFINVFLNVVCNILVLVSCIYILVITSKITIPHFGSSHGLDRNILFNTMFGIFLFHTASLVAYFSLNNLKQSKNVHVGTNLMAFFIIVLQVLMINKLLNKKIGSEFMVLRNFLTFVAIVNLSLWIQNTFLLTEFGENFPVQIKFFGLFGWVLIWRIAQPLCAFFRFHSFVTLLQISWQGEETRN